jgi:predicted transport protein
MSDKNPKTIPVFMAFRKHALAAGKEVTEKVSRTMVAWKGKRTFATACIKGKYLECSIDLLRAVDHKHPKASFHTTKAVVTNRFTLEPHEVVDAPIQAWLREACGQVGPSTRNR